MDAAVKDAGGSRERRFSFAGDSWTAKLYYQDGNLKPPAGGETPAGTEVAQENIREFRVAVKCNDEVEERKANFHVRPRWANLEAETSNGGTTDIPVPESLANTDTDAVSVRISGSNIAFDQYGDLLRAAVEAVDVNQRYFDGRHPTSNVTDAARYVRVHKDRSGPIHARAGPLAQLAHVLEDDRDGFRKLVQNDANERNEKLPGFYHSTTLGPERVREVMPDHEHPVELKHYYAREALDRDGPLSHPKLEASLQKSRLPHDETVEATPEALANLTEELDEWLFSVLADAGLDLRAGGGLYESDAYFEATNAPTDASVVSLDLTEIRHEQESVVYRHLADGMPDSQRETLACLVTDGGELSPADLAEQTDRHRDTVYAALQSMNDLVQHEYGEVSLRSTYVSELVTDALEAAEGAVARATNAAAEAVEAERRGLDEHTSAFVAWAERYGINYSDGDGDTVTVEVGEVNPNDGDTVHQTVRQLLREGLELWREMGRDEARFRAGDVHYRVPVNGLSDATRRARGTVWQMVRE
jgi:hypothetical protein